MKTIANPHKQIVAPAIGCIYFSNIFVGNIFIPYNDTITMPSMVPIVQMEKIADTYTTPKVLALAAGYISNGIKGSQGPNTNIVNSTHGVND
jgi:hypothetical protein